MNESTFSFSSSKVKESNSNTPGLRPRVKSGSKVDDILRNYVRPNEQVGAQTQKSANGHPIPSYGALDANLSKTVSDRRDIKNILEMNPNAQLAIDICVNGTLSPNNTLDSQLQYKSSYDKLGAIKSTLLQKIREIMNAQVELEDILPTVLKDAKYDVGSYALLVVPTGRIREMIKSEKLERTNSDQKIMKFESMINDFSNVKRPLQADKRYLEPSALSFKLEDIGLETTTSLDVSKLITVHSDLEIIRMNKMRENWIKQEAVNGCLDSLEDFSNYDIKADMAEMAKEHKQEGLDESVIADSLNRARNYAFDDVISLAPEVDPDGIDMAVHMHIPHESIFVMHKPGSPEDHVGYYIALDMSGNPISVGDELNIHNPNYNGTYGNDASNSAMSGQANFAAGNTEMGFSGMNNSSIQGRRISDKTALFSKVTEKQLVDKIKSGYFKHHDISLAEHKDLMQTMFQRLLSNKQTQLIFVPASLMTYIAFEYDENGNGISLIIKHKNIGVLNSILTLANTLSAINNTIDYKEVRVKFDDDELDFNKTTDMVIGNLVRHSSMNGSRLLSTDVYKQFDYLGTKGYQLAFEDHPSFPGTSVEINNLDRERAAPDVDVMEKNEALLIQSLGSTPEVVDMARNVEFASSYFQSNLQAARRAIADQKILTKFLDKFIRTYLMNSPLALKWMIQEIDRSRKDNPELRGIKTIELVRGFINSVTTHLPKPDMVKVELLDKAITEQEKLVDHVLKYTIGEEALQGEDVGEHLEATLEAIRRKIKAVIMRDFLASNNMFNEGIINAIFNNDEEELDSAMGRIESQQEFTLNFLKKHEIVTATTIKRVNDDLNKIKEARDLDAGSGGGFDTSTTETSTDNNADPNADPNAGGEADPFADNADSAQTPAEDPAQADNADPFA